MQRAKKRKNEKSFTLLELLIVIAVIAILAAIVLVALDNAKQSAWESRGLQFSQNIRTALATDLVGEWSFDSGSGTATNVIDDSGNNNNGTWSGTGTPHWVTGKVRIAGNFNGTNDYVLVNNTGSVCPNLCPNNITISLWVYNQDTTFSTYRTILLKGSGTVRSYYLDVRTSTGYLFGEINVSGTRQQITSSSVVSPKSWHHVTLTYNGSVAKLYLNSKIVGEKTGLSGNLYYDTTSLYIGNYNNFYGIIDEVQIYKTALTAEQVKQLYAEGLSRHLVKK